MNTILCFNIEKISKLFNDLADRGEKNIRNLLPKTFEEEMNES